MINILTSQLLMAVISSINWFSDGLLPFTHVIKSRGLERSVYTSLPSIAYLPELASERYKSKSYIPYYDIS